MIKSGTLFLIANLSFEWVSEKNKSKIDCIDNSSILGLQSQFSQSLFSEFQNKPMERTKCVMIFEILTLAYYIDLHSYISVVCLVISLSIIVLSTERFTDLGKLNLSMEVRFYAQANFCYCLSCLKKWRYLQKWSKSSQK